MQFIMPSHSAINAIIMEKRLLALQSCNKKKRIIKKQINSDTTCFVYNNKYGNCPGFILLQMDGTLLLSLLTHLTRVAMVETMVHPGFFLPLVFFIKVSKEVELPTQTQYVLRALNFFFFLIFNFFFFCWVCTKPTKILG